MTRARRVVRDLHDGAQQRLVHTIITLKLAQRRSRGPSDAEALVAEALETAERAIAELRELAHGILPSVLTHGGLRAGVNAFVARLDLPVDVDVSSERLPPDIEASAYFIVAEALTNVVKHARATRATVRAASMTASSLSRCATMESAGRSPRAMASWASPIGSTRSAVGCGSKAQTARGRCWPPGCRCRLGGGAGRNVVERGAVRGVSTLRMTMRQAASAFQRPARSASMTPPTCCPPLIAARTAATSAE